MKWKITKRAVNSKPLFEEIHDFVGAGMSETGLSWTSDALRHSYLDLVDELLSEVADEGKIEQWDVRCDARNNKASDMANGKFILDVFYKQRNCLNTTQLHYEVDTSDDILDMDIVF